jgi:outer membrane protein assembly factor BamB
MSRLPKLPRPGRVPLAIAVLAVAGGALLFLVARPRHAPLVRGSISTEYTPTVVAPQPPPPAGEAWSTYGYDQERTRAASFGLRPPFRQLWTFHGRALLEFPPVVAYGLVYLPTFDGRLYALDAPSGRVVWHRRAERCGWSSPAVDDHVLYVTFIGSSECSAHEQGGEVDAFDAFSGKLRWRRLIGPTESSPLVADGNVFVGDWNGTIWALDAVTGRTRWTAATNGAIKGSLALSGHRLYIGNYAGEMLSLDATTGRIVWRSGGHGSFYSSPAVAYGRVYIGSLDDGVYAFGAATGNLLWARPTGGYVYASPAVWQHRVLVGSYDHRFYALDAGTGDVLWRFDADGPISGAATVLDGLVYFSTLAERTYALNARNGQTITTWPDGKYSPVVADGTNLYLVGYGRLYALTER